MRILTNNEIMSLSKNIMLFLNKKRKREREREREKL